jgi:Domain of unknown function (DUF932)
MRVKNMNAYKHYSQKAMEQVIFPDVVMRGISHIRQEDGETTLIQGYNAVVNQHNDHTFAIVKDGYKPVQHAEVIDLLDTICREYPEYGNPEKEMWLSNQMGRMRVRYTFKDVNYEVRPGDAIHPTFESYASHDTSLAQRFDVGAFRFICTNGMKIGKSIAHYKKKHVESLDLQIAREMIQIGMRNFSETQKLLIAFTERQALENEVFMYESLPFSPSEKFDVETQIKRQGKVIKWDDKEPESRKVEINMYDLYNIYTDIASHNVLDMNRQLRLEDGIAKAFAI